MAAHRRRLLGTVVSKASGGVVGQQLVAIIDPRAAKLATGRHWVEDDGAARLEATRKIKP